MTNNITNGFKTQEWKDIRIKEINAMGYKCDDSHPCFDEVQAIYSAPEGLRSYKEFKDWQRLQAVNNSILEPR